MKKIPLSQGQYALVDDADYLSLSKFKWFALKYRKHFYAGRSATINGKHFTLFMHRLIINTPPGFHTDHINHNGLDNRRRNLRIATPRENGMNRRGLQSNNTSGFTGVSWFEQRRKWRVRTTINGKQILIGFFDNKRNAAEAYKKFVASLMV